MERIKTYEEFWPYYLSQHAQPLTRKLHAVGSLLAVAVLVYAAVEQPLMALLVPIVGYGFAWFSHFVIEHNRPATWEYPLWSLISDGRLAWGVLRGKL